MSPVTPTEQQDERLLELLADQALEGLDKAEELELESMLAAGSVDRDLSLMTTAACLELALMHTSGIEPMPARVERRLIRSGGKWGRATSSVLRPSFRNPSSDIARRTQQVVVVAGPWLAAAACLLLAVVAWWPRPTPDIVSTLRHAPDRMALTLAEWGDPAVKGVHGHVVWCEKLQKGYVRLVNLPPNDPASEQYQVWIMDDRGMEQRISGGVFDVEDPKETIVPINPGIPVRNAKAFAVTIEKPGGCWISDLRRRVAIASNEGTGR